MWRRGGGASSSRVSIRDLSRAAAALQIVRTSYRKWAHLVSVRVAAPGPRVYPRAMAARSTVPPQAVPRPRRLIPALCLLAMIAAGTATPGRAAFTMRGPETQAWPPGTEVVPFEFRGGQIMVRATILSASGRDTSGLLVFDSGSPEFVMTLGAWNALSVDTIEVNMNGAHVVHRDLTAIEMGGARVPNVDVEAVVPDSILPPGVLGLFAPSVYGGRAVVVDYASERLAIINRRLTLVGQGTSAAQPSGGAGVSARIARSRAQYGEVLAKEAVPVPFRRFKGGRMLVNARVSEPAYGWSGQPLTLLIDSGASGVVVFADAMAERVRPPSRWSREAAVPFSTVLGKFHADELLLPRLQLTDASPAVDQGLVAAMVSPRDSLPDLQGELPETVHGLLGNDFLSRFRVVLDYANDLLWLEERAVPSAPRLTGHHVGLRVAELWGELRIVAVQPGSEAQRAGILEGDVVIAIDHVPARSLNEAAAEQQLQGAPGRTVVLSLRRDQVERVFTLKRTSPP